jgi:hypothetical protein
MNPYESELLPTTAASVTDVSNGIVLVLSALFMLMPLVMLVGLVYSGIRNRRRASAKEPGAGL